MNSISGEKQKKVTMSADVLYYKVDTSVSGHGPHNMNALILNRVPNENALILGQVLEFDSAHPQFTQQCRTGNFCFRQFVDCVS